MKRVALFFIFVFFVIAPLRADQNYAVVLQYHRFDDARYPSTNISMDLFKKQMSYLTQHDFTVWPLSKVVRYLREHKSLPDKTVCITIDDAYRTAYTHAYPLLKKMHFPFTLFVSTLPVIHKSKNYLTWDMMREMGKNGAEFANHTYSHPYLVRENKQHKDKRAFVIEEIQKCEKKLVKELGEYVATTPKMLAYPFGEYDKALMKIVQKLGYVGVAQNSGVISSESNFMAVRRFPMAGGYGVMKQFVVKVNAVSLPLASQDDFNTLVTPTNNPPLLTVTLKKPLKGFSCFNADGEHLRVTPISDTKFQIEALKPLAYPRNHYTCTAPTDKPGKWYWYSHLWVVLQKQGSN